MSCNLAIVVLDVTHTFVKVYVEGDVTPESSFFYLPVNISALPDTWCNCSVEGAVRDVSLSKNEPVLDLDRLQW